MKKEKVQFVSDEDYAKCSINLKDSLYHYIEEKRPVGSFLTAVLSNDLFDSFGRADHMNRIQLYNIVSWIYNYAPTSCYGSRDIVKAWLVKDEE